MINVLQGIDAMLVGLESPNDCESRVFIAIVDLTLTNKLKEK